MNLNKPCAPQAVWGALLAAASSLANSACVSYSLLGGSHTLEKNKYEFAVLGGYSFESPVGLNGRVPAYFEVGGRYGLSDQLDVGFRAYSAGASLCGRFQIFETPRTEATLFDALVELTAGARVANYCTCNSAVCTCDDQPVPHIQLRVVTGLRQEWVEIVIGPHGDLELFPINGTLAPVFQLGGDIALLAHLPMGWWLGPEVVVLVPIGEVASTTLRKSPNIPQAQVALGIFKTF